MGRGGGEASIREVILIKRFVPVWTFTLILIHFFKEIPKFVFCLKRAINYVTKHNCFKTKTHEKLTNLALLTKPPQNDTAN